MNVLEKWLEFETRPLTVTSPSAYVAVMLLLCCCYVDVITHRILVISVTYTYGLYCR